MGRPKRTIFHLVLCGSAESPNRLADDGETLPATSDPFTRVHAFTDLFRRSFKDWGLLTCYGA